MARQGKDDDGTRLIARHLHASYPLDLEERAMDLHLRLLAERASDALTAHDLARLAAVAKRFKQP